jgi:glycerol-3-phosphate dehydrogenase
MPDCDEDAAERTTAERRRQSGTAFRDGASALRHEAIERIRRGEPWDLVIVGGGATGLGAAVDAATRGYRALLLEAHDFAKGTSSRSTKLIHGGVRYLAQGRIGLVREALHERAILLRNAPHVVHTRAFLVPAYSRLDRPFYGLGLAMYDLLAGPSPHDRSRRVGRAEAISLAPTLRPEGLRGGVVYRDGQFDDARLAITLLRTFQDHGGTALNHVGVTAFTKAGPRITGVAARDALTGETWAIPAKGVLNATGVFADAIRRLDDPAARPMIRPSRGAHLVLDGSVLPGQTAVLIPKTDDRRVAFAIPWEGRVLLGTTDVPADGTAIEPRPSADEIEYLLGLAARYFPRPTRREDVRSTFAGLRPLIDRRGHRGTARLSREHAVLVAPSGLVTITGGKWTTYRRMAADAIDHVAEVAGLPRRPCVTADLKLHGWAEPGTQGGPFSAYGSDAGALDRLVASRPALGEPLHPDLPYALAEVVWAAQHESARTVEDVLARRTRALLLDARASLAAAPGTAALLAEQLGTDRSWQEGQVRSFAELAASYELSSSR